MKRIIILFFVTICELAFGQDVIKTDLPTVVPPSPSVQGLMKFEEVPVNNYTGTPDISIPLINSSTSSKDINLDISLKYHPANVKANNIAGDVGLGWSLFAGGTISRTVRGLPDEIKDTPRLGFYGKIGLYQNDLSNSKNMYYEFAQDPLNNVLNNPAVDEFFFEATENGKYDTEHDLWQFNFMGYSGKFIIKKNTVLGTLEIVPLSDYRLKIINNYGTVNQQTFVPTGFIVFDEKGNKYVFDVFETTTRAVDSQFKTVIQNDLIISKGQSNENKFRSSFHLTKIFDNNQALVMDINYNGDSEQEKLVETNRQVTLTRNEYGNSGDAAYEAMRYSNCWGEIPPFEILSASLSIVEVKKIQNIVIPNIAKVEFSYLSGRQDTNTILSNITYLDEIKLKNYNSNEIISKLKFEYDYNELIEKRMFLNSISKQFPNTTVQEKHEFFYNHGDPIFLSSHPLGSDYWGYFNTFNSDNCQTQNLTFLKEASPSVSTLDLLQKIKYPTKGSVLFQFESNQYSFIGDQPIVDYRENPFNNELLNSADLAFNSIALQYLPVHNEDRKAIFKPSIVLPQDQLQWNRTFRLIKIVNGQQEFVGAIYCIEPNNNCCKEIILEKNVQYALRREQFLNPPYTGTDYMHIDYYGFTNTNHYLVGGGNRIAKIGYFEQDIDQKYYDTLHLNSDGLQKEKQYSYQWIDDPSKSSGSLVFEKPKFEEYRFLDLSSSCPLPPFNNYNFTSGNFSYLSRSTSNNQEMVSTHGSDVGYKYVRISETNKGKIEEEYTSPIDYPEIFLNNYIRPYLPSKDIDYKRGLLLKQIVKDESNKVLKKDSLTYEFVNFENSYGYRLNKPDGVSFNGRLDAHGVQDGIIFPSDPHNYSFYNTLLNQQLPFVEYCISSTGGNTVPSIICDSFSKSKMGDPTGYIFYYNLLQAYGWAKMATKNYKNYFYENGVQKILESNESFIYNTVNKKIQEHTVTSPDGTSSKTKYYYDYNNSPNSQNRISEIKKIESFKNNLLINTKEIEYFNGWGVNVSFLPKYIKGSLGTNTLDTELTFDKYDLKGNLIQYTSKGGVPTTIIWGYHNTQPIAKIEGATHAGIAGYATDIITASNTDASAATGNDETTFIAALDNFRMTVESLRRQNVQITTYTYDPLVGVRSITPPSGLRGIYIYDATNKLKEIKQQEKDASGTLVYKTVQEFQYNYKP